MACSTDFFFCNSSSEQRSPAARASASRAINIAGAHQPGVTQERGSPTEREYVGAAHIEKVGPLFEQGRFSANSMWQKFLKYLKRASEITQSVSRSEHWSNENVVLGSACSYSNTRQWRLEQIHHKRWLKLSDRARPSFRTKRESVDFEIGKQSKRCNTHDKEIDERRFSHFTLLCGFRLPWPPSCCLYQPTPFLGSDQRRLWASMKDAIHISSFFQQNVFLDGWSQHEYRVTQNYVIIGCTSIWWPSL